MKRRCRFQGSSACLDPHRSNRPGLKAVLRKDYAPHHSFGFSFNFHSLISDLVQPTPRSIVTPLSADLQVFVTNTIHINYRSNKPSNQLSTYSAEINGTASQASPLIRKNKGKAQDNFFAQTLIGVSPTLSFSRKFIFEDPPSQAV